MSYSAIEIPHADADDFAAVFGTDDPRGAIAQHLRDLKAKRDELDLEIEKWQRADGAAELFVSDVDLAKSAVKRLPIKIDGEQGPQSPPIAAAAPAGGEPPATRREAIIRLLHEDPERFWKTRELVNALFERGWSGEGSRDSVSNSVSNILGKLEEEGMVEKIRKGQYRLRSTPTATQEIA